MKKFNLFAICVMACLFAGCEPKVTEQKPTVLTLDVTDVTTTSAIVNCNVVSDGGASVTDRGVAYDTYPNPKATGTRCKAGTGIGKYSCTLTNLEDNKTYYVRAYAKNEVGIEYGKEISFTTIQELVPPIVTTVGISDILATSAIVTGTIISDGGVPVSECGVVYNTSENPTITDNRVLANECTETFRCELTGLQGQTTYFVRAYAINEKGVAYGKEQLFTTKTIYLPSVSTSEATQISYKSATINGSVTSDGGANVTERGVVYSTSKEPSTSDNKMKNGNGTGYFSCTLSDLKDGVTYYVRAYATNSAGTSYGNEIKFTTLEPIQQEAVDLGLSVKWATMNVGAEDPADYGNYFAWGETEPKYSVYFVNWSEYKWCEGSMYKLTKYCTDSTYGIVDNKTVLETIDDAATANWGGSWRMPTPEEIDELCNNCTWTRGDNGYKVTGSNGNSIFLPAAGYFDNERGIGYGSGLYGSYWSNYTGGGPSAYSLNFYFPPWDFTVGWRCLGKSVRPVCP